MTSNRTNAKQSKKSKFINQKIKGISFSKHAKESGFNKRKAQKVTGKSLLLAFFLMALQGKNSFQLWAEQVNNVIGKTVSKQAIWKKITPRLIIFLRFILADALLQQIDSVHQNIKQGRLRVSGYKRILVQDSTVIALPDWLNKWYPGNTSGGKRKSQLKIQVVVDLIANKFVHFEITPFTANDQSKSKDILSIARKGDLVIRDLGYFSLDCFDQMNETVSFVSRIQYGVKIFDFKTGEEINIIKHLKKHKRFEQWVLIGCKQKVKVRLVILPLSIEQANEKRYRAKCDRDKRLNHSPEYYELLGYCLFITTENQKQFTANQIAKLYGLRWRIENIFKCWKSQFHLQELIPKNCSLNKERVESIIYMMLIFIVLFQVTIYNYMILKSEKIENCTISLTKLCQYIVNNIMKFFDQTLKSLVPEILYYCTYDKRSDRQNFIQKLKLG
jgi:hypothetical protein